MKARSALLYSVLRIAFFVVPLAVMMLFPIMRQQYLLSAIFAALIGLSLSIIFLRGPRSDVSTALASRREKRPRDRTDEDVEDALD